MQYLIGNFRIGAKVGANLDWSKNLKFFEELQQNMQKGDELIIVGKLFEYDQCPAAEDFMFAFNLLLKFQEKSNVKISFSDNYYTKNLATILGIELIEDDRYKIGSETKKVGEIYFLACPYYLEGEKRSKHGYFKNGEFIENLNSSKTLEVLITADTDLKELKKITEEKKDDIIKIELDKKMIEQISDESNSDLILLLNQDNVLVEKVKEEVILETDDIDFKPTKNFYIKLLMSIINNRDMTEAKKNAYIKVLKEVY